MKPSTNWYFWIQTTTIKWHGLLGQAYYYRMLQVATWLRSDYWLFFAISHLPTKIFVRSTLYKIRILFISKYIQEEYVTLHILYVPSLSLILKTNEKTIAGNNQKTCSPYHHSCALKLFKLRFRLLYCSGSKLGR